MRPTQGSASLRPGLSNRAPFGAFVSCAIETELTLRACAKRGGCLPARSIMNRWMKRSCEALVQLVPTLCVGTPMLTLLAASVGWPGRPARAAGSRRAGTRGRAIRGPLPLVHAPRVCSSMVHAQHRCSVCGIGRRVVVERTWRSLLSLARPGRSEETAGPPFDSHFTIPEMPVLPRAPSRSVCCCPAWDTAPRAPDSGRREPLEHRRSPPHR